ncbi:MAG: hypothetical protein ABFS19_01005 [Thermodesulfobacteriota bacterium]
MLERAIIHLNVADFAVAVERLEDTSLRSRPLLIAAGAGGRASVYDMSEEAYQDGVRKGMRLSRARRLCRRAAVLPPQPLLYRRAMQGLVSEVSSFSPKIEQGLLDGHLFVDVTGTHRLFGPPPDIAWRLRKQLGNRLGIRPIWTVATSKLVSKVASRLVKPLGEYIVGPGEESAFLAPLPLTILPGVSRHQQGRMAEFNLSRVGELASLSPQQLMVIFGKGGEFLHQVSRGIDSCQVHAENESAAKIFFEHLFDDDCGDHELVRICLRGLAGRLCRKLRSRQLECRRVMVELHHSDGRRSTGGSSGRQGSSRDVEIEKMAFDALLRAWSMRSRLRSCRLIADRLQKVSPQLSLFCTKNPRQLREEKLFAAMDRVRSRFGHDAVWFGPGKCADSSA